MKVISFRELIDLEPKPLTVRFNGVIYNLYDSFGYQSEEEYESQKCYSFLANDIELRFMKEKNIEIIEEDKPIEKIKIENDSPTHFYIKNEFGTKCGLTRHSRIIAEKVNEIIDEVNKLKKEKEKCK